MPPDPRGHPFHAEGFADAVGSIRHYQYNADNRLTQLTDALGNTRTFTYNIRKEPSR